MIKPNWDIFKAKFSENPQENFEWFSYLLFCKEFNKPHGIFRYKNQSGIETDPIETTGEVIGWQAKFYEDTLSNHKNDLLSAIEKSKRDYPSITKVIFYTNSEWGQSRGNSNDPQAKIDVEKKAKELGIKIVWNTASFFESPFVSLEQEIISSYFFSESSLVDLSPQKGWYPYENWANPIQGIEEEYIVSDKTVIINDLNETKPIVEGLNELRAKLLQEGSVVRLVGLSGVGKTRFVQAIFDERIGINTPEPSLVCYTDMSRDPDPSPLVMAEQLLEIGEQVILIVDNCPPDLHRELVKTVTKDGSKLSLLTVEYDVRDDLPEETDVYKLEPNSLEVIEKIIDQRFEHISQIDARSIAEFSGGNARIALALANTIQKDETLSGLKDEELFKRLFQQRNDPNDSLIQSAEVLSLVYSFNAKETDDGSELAFLSKLIGKNTIDLYRDIEILRKRDLIQVRGDWKAVLPQAISNRLAKQALDSMPQDYIVERFLNHGSERLIKSFAHRLSFLHDSKVAVNISEDWLKEDGWLGENMCNFNELGMDIFKYIASVTPEKALSCMETAAKERKTDFLNPDKNKNAIIFVHLLRHIAYDPEYFDRAVQLICQFTIIEKKETKYNTIEEVVKTLFWLYLSGTHATASQRIKIIDNLLDSKNSLEQELGLALLDAALETDHFTSHYHFDFGARSRDFGWQPQTNKELSDWYQIYLTEVERIALSDDSIMADKVKHLLAKHFRGLWSRAYSFDLLIDIAKRIHDKSSWTEGWLAIKEAIHFDHTIYSSGILTKIEDLRDYLSPQNLYAQAQVYIIPEQYYSKECFEFKEKEDQEKCQKKLNFDAFNSGVALAHNKVTFASLLPEIVKSNNYMLPKLIQGIVSTYTDHNELWSLIYEEYKKTPKSDWDITAIYELFKYWASSNLNLLNTLLDQILNDDDFAEYYPYLQTTHIDQIGIERLHKSLDIEKTSLWKYGTFAYGNKHSTINDKELAKLITHILTKEDGFSVALEILHMRFHSKTTSKHDSTLINIGYDLLLSCEYEKNTNDSIDHKLEIIAKTCFYNDPNPQKVEQVYKEFSSKIDVFNLSYFNNTQQVLAEFSPILFLTNMYSNKSIRTSPCGLLNNCEKIYESYENIPDDILLQWVDGNIDKVFFLIKVIRPLDKDKKIKKIIYALIDTTTKKIEVLETILSSMMPSSWSGSRANRYRDCLPLLSEFKKSDIETINQWADAKYDEFLILIQSIEEKEKNESQQRYERFE